MSIFLRGKNGLFSFFLFFCVCVHSFNSSSKTHTHTHTHTHTYITYSYSYSYGLFAALLSRTLSLLWRAFLKLCFTYFYTLYCSFIIFWFISLDSPNKYVFSLFLNWVMFSLSLISIGNLLYSLGALYCKDLSPLQRFVLGSKSLCRSLACLTVTLVSSSKGTKYSYKFLGSPNFSAL